MKLFPHQQEVLKQTENLNKVAFYMDMGLGKTFVGSEKMLQLNKRVVNDNGLLRDLTLSEYKKLQTIPEWYSFGNLIKSKATDLIGDGWTVDVIAHLLRAIKTDNSQMA